jgi:hypothetical protein
MNLFRISAALAGLLLTSPMRSVSCSGHQGGPHSARVGGAAGQAAPEGIATRAGRSNTPRPSQARTACPASLSRSRPLVTRTTSASIAGIA